MTISTVTLGSAQLQESTIASATTCDIGSLTTLKAAITGTTTITSFGVQIHRLRLIRFTGILTLTYNATSLKLPTSANITTAAGDHAIATSDGSGNWDVREYYPVSGKPLVAGAAADITDSTTTGRALVTAASASAARTTIGLAWGSLPYVDKGTVGTGTVTFDRSAAIWQRLQVSGALTVAVSNWPTAGTYGEIDLEIVNGGSATVTWPTVTWVNGFTPALQSSGTDFVRLWSHDGGTTVFGSYNFSNRLAAIEFLIDGGGSVIATGNKNGLMVPFAGRITGVNLTADQSGSIVVDIWKLNYSSYPPTVANTITASALPTLSSALKYQDTTLTGWTTGFVGGDYFFFNVNSCTTITRALLSLTVVKGQSS